MYFFTSELDDSFVIGLDSRESFNQCRLTCTVVSYECGYLTCVCLEVDSFKYVDGAEAFLYSGGKEPSWDQSSGGQVTKWGASVILERERGCSSC